MPRSLPVARLSRYERAVLALLRACGGETVEGRCEPEISIRAMLADIAGESVTLRPPDAPHVAAIELKLVAWLASAQRSAVPDAPIAASVKRCAVALDAAGYHLPFRATLRTPPDARAQPPRAPRHVTAKVQNATGRGAVSNRGSLRTTAILLARRSGELSVQDFLRIGISRQYLSRLCAYGDLVRVGVARYRASELRVTGT